MSRYPSMVYWRVWSAIISIIGLQGLRLGLLFLEAACDQVSSSLWNKLFFSSRLLQSIFACRLPNNSNSTIHVKLSAHQRAEERAARSGIFLKSYEARTEDGYILTTFRCSLDGRDKDRPVILLLPGMLCDSDIFLCPIHSVEDRGNRARHSLLAQLLDRGWDVWLGNTRGSIYSRHRRFGTGPFSSFWSFSLEEMMSRDVPALLAQVLATSRQTRLALLGYSQGGLLALGALARRKDLSSIVSAVITLDAFLPSPPRRLLSAQSRPLALTLAVGRWLGGRYRGIGALAHSVLSAKCSSWLLQRVVGTVARAVAEGRRQEVLRCWLGSSTSLGVLGHWHSLLTRSASLGRLEDVDCPVLLLCTGEDDEGEGYSEEAARRMGACLGCVNVSPNRDHYDLLVSQSAPDTSFPLILGLLDSFIEM